MPTTIMAEQTPNNACSASGDCHFVPDYGTEDCAFSPTNTSENHEDEKDQNQQHTTPTGYVADGRSLIRMTLLDSGKGEIQPLSSALKIFSLPVSKWNMSLAASVYMLFKVEGHIVRPNYFLSIASEIENMRHLQLDEMWNRVQEENNRFEPYITASW